MRKEQYYYCQMSSKVIDQVLKVKEGTNKETKKSTVAESNSRRPIRRQRLIHCDHCDVMRQHPAGHEVSASLSIWLALVLIQFERI